MIGGDIETVKNAVAVKPSSSGDPSKTCSAARRAVTTVTVAAQVRARALYESIAVCGNVCMRYLGSRPHTLADPRRAAVGNRSPARSVRAADRGLGGLRR